MSAVIIDAIIKIKTHFVIIIFQSEVNVAQFIRLCSFVILL